MDRHGPTLDVQVAQYPTPISSDATGSRSSKGSARPDEGGLLHAVKDYSATSNVLSANWVEWLMGIPQGWTDIDRRADYDTWIAGDPGAGHIHWVKEDGLPRTVANQKNRVSRLKMLGNGIVPGTAALAIKELSARLY
jgi:hypothetical protein